MTSTSQSGNLEQNLNSINTLRCLAAGMVTKANSGHPGAPMGLAPLAYTLFTRVMNFNPENPKWINRDRFVLSNGHSCALLYSSLFLSGYPSMTLDDLKSFRQWQSKTPGHPESHMTDGVEVTTGPLGQGIAQGIGIAWAQSHLGSKYNRPGHSVFDHYTYIIAGDGCLMEGVANEACALAGAWKLSNLIVLYDDNDITIDGRASLTIDNVTSRFEAYGWSVSSVEKDDSNCVTGNVNPLLAAIEAAKKDPKPSLIRIKTTIGYGSPKADSPSAHGSPFSVADMKQIRKNYGFPSEDLFQVDPASLSDWRQCVKKGKASEQLWTQSLASYKAEFPDLYKQLSSISSCSNKYLPSQTDIDQITAALPKWSTSDKAEATRSCSGKVLNAIAKVFPSLVGGSADLAGSNKSWLKFEDAKGAYSHDNPGARNIHFGVRESGQHAIATGIAAHGTGLFPFAATFLNFTYSYAINSIRVTALSHIPLICIATHDSIGLGMDGPTHQPIEAMAAFRATPQILCLRPADGNETSGCYLAALQHPGPSIICLSRQNLAQLEKSSSESVAKYGAYPVYSKTDTPDIILVATGSEVELCIKAAKSAPFSTKVVSMPCQEIFNKQTTEYKQSLFPAGTPVMAVEAGSSLPWFKYSHDQVCIDTFGSSAPAGVLWREYGFSSVAIVNKCQALLSRYSSIKPNPLFW